MTAATLDRDPVFAAAREQEQLAEVERVLGASPSATASLVGPDGVETELPASLYRVLVLAVRELAIGNGVDPPGRDGADDPEGGRPSERVPTVPDPTSRAW